MFALILFYVILALGPLFVLVLGIHIIRLLQGIIPSAARIEELAVRVALLEQRNDRERT